MKVVGRPAAGVMWRRVTRRAVSGSPSKNTQGFALVPQQAKRIESYMRGMLKKAASRVLALLPCSCTACTLRASIGLRPCWTDFFEHSRSLMLVAHSGTSLAQEDGIFNRPMRMINRKLSSLLLRISCRTIRKNIQASPMGGQAGCEGPEWTMTTPILLIALVLHMTVCEAAVPDPSPRHSTLPELSDSNLTTRDQERSAVLDIEPDAIIVMKEKSFEVVKGGLRQEKVTVPHFTLRAGEDILLVLRNEDKLAHEFVSPLFRKVDLEFSGQASIIYTHTAAGVRIEPGQIISLRFWLPERFYDLFYFWCDVHGKLYGDKMRGEIFILESTQ